MIIKRSWFNYQLMASKIKDLRYGSGDLAVKANDQQRRDMSGQKLLV